MVRHAPSGQEVRTVAPGTPRPTLRFSIYSGDSNKERGAKRWLARKHLVRSTEWQAIGVGLWRVASSTTPLVPDRPLCAKPQPCPSGHPPSPEASRSPPQARKRSPTR